MSIYYPDTFIAFDVETTGLSAATEEVIEIGAVKFKNSKPVDEFSFLIKPTKRVPEESIKVHKITNEMLKTEPLMKEVLPKFVDFCSDSLLVAHNAGFDFKFIEKHLKIEKIKSPKGLVLDTLSISRAIVKDTFSFKLSSLVNKFNIDAEVFHRATDDAKYCGFLFIELINRFKAENPSKDFSNIINLSNNGLRFKDFYKEQKQRSLFV